LTSALSCGTLCFDIVGIAPRRYFARRGLFEATRCHDQAVMDADDSFLVRRRRLSCRVSLLDIIISGKFMTPPPIPADCWAMFGDSVIEAFSELF
jgi:hypothetical protein